MNNLSKEIVQARLDFVNSISEKHLKVLRFMGYRLSCPEEITVCDIKLITGSVFVVDKLKKLKRVVGKRLVA